MVGKTTRVTKDGIAGAVNSFCGYIVVEAETVEAAARLFENHPHFSVFPGDSVDIMPFLTDPAPEPSAESHTPRRVDSSATASHRA